jgi:hypothetical protein
MTKIPGSATILSFIMRRKICDFQILNLRTYLRVLNGPLLIQDIRTADAKLLVLKGVGKCLTNRVSRGLRSVIVG